MSRTVCSWCKVPLVLKDDILVCSNTDCPACDEKYLHEELIRTRKALAFAKSKLNGIHRLYSKAFYTREDWLQVCMEMVNKANIALEEITALEQKD